MVVSSVTPLTPAAMPVQRLGSSRSDWRSRPRMMRNSSDSAVASSGTAPFCLVLAAEVDEQRRVAAVVEDHVGAAAVGPAQRPVGAPPVLLERLALPGVDRDAGRVLGGAVADDDRRRGVVLGREDVAGGPAHLGAERGERLDEHRGLNGHVQGPGDPRARERLAVGELGADGHQARHLVLGERDLLAAEGGQPEVGDLEVGLGGRSGGGHAVSVRSSVRKRPGGGCAWPARSAASRRRRPRRAGSPRR